MKIFQFFISAIVCLAIAEHAMAKPDFVMPTLSEPIAAPTNQRIVTYTYSPHMIYRIYTSPLLHTHIELGADEGLKETPVAGDTIQWRISGGPRHIYIKPIRGGITTSLTIVTNKRTYQFQLIAQEKPKHLYQKVSFEFSYEDESFRLMPDVKTKSKGVEKNKQLSQEKDTRSPSPMTGTLLSALDFNFTMHGQTNFKPLHVYTDGRMTYVKLPNTQDIPAVFMQDEDKRLSLVNYRLSQDVMVIERLVKHLLLKLGDEEILIDYKGSLTL